MGYIDDEQMVRVDIWRQSGKWYETIALKWDRYFTTIDGQIELIHDTFKRCMHEQHPGIWLGMRATCLEPYHENTHPISIEI